jgi:hypothetical protein
MDNLIPYIVTALLSFAVGYALKHIEPKSKLVWWSPHNFLFNVDVVPEQPKVSILTHAITIQNLGRKSAEVIEIIHRFRPDHFKLQPAFDYEEDYTPDKEHIIRIQSLASKEFFSIEFLSYKSLPELVYIRSKDGEAKFIKIQPQRVFPRWLQLLSLFFIFIGFGFSIFWIIKAIYFISQHF